MRVRDAGSVTAHLRVRTRSGSVRGIALVLHGGRDNGTRRVSPLSPAYLRMHPFANALYRAGAAHGLAIAQLRYVVQGWNGPLRSPVADARWALDQLRLRFGDAPVGLVGHSMGGRTALAVADDASVTTVVGLAPWIEPGDPLEPITGRNLLIAHGSNDHTTSPATSAAFAESARAIARQVTYVAVAGEGHPLLRRPRFWHQLAARYTVEMVLGRSPDGSVDPDTANIVRAAVAGEALLRA
jgi:alpha-beta hydrolase superfamily lysophospholipase